MNSEIQPPIAIAKPGSSHVAADGTLLIAADSFVSTSEDHRDPSSEAAFRFVADVICSGLELELPHPGQAHDGQQSPLFHVWNRLGIHRQVEQAVSPKLLEVARDSEGAFLKLVLNNQAHISRWLSHQLNRANFEQYRGGRNSFEILAGCRDRLDNALKHRSLSIDHFSEVQVSQCDSDVLIEMKRLAGDINSNDQLIALAYAFHAAIKGPAYAAQLVQAESEAMYRTHWLRDAIYTKGSITRVLSEGSAMKLFPWGAVLTQLVHRFRSQLTTDSTLLSDIMFAVRAFHLKNFDRIHLMTPEATRSFITDALNAANVKSIILTQSGIAEYSKQNSNHPIRNIGYQRLGFVADSMAISESLRNGGFSYESKHRWGAGLDAELAQATERGVRAIHAHAFEMEPTPDKAGNPDYAAFYNSADFREVESIVLGLEARQYRPFLYPASQDILRETPDQIEEAIRNSPLNLFFVGQNGVGSYQLKEATYAAAWNKQAPLKNIVIIMESYVGKVDLPSPLNVMEYIDSRYTSGEFWSKVIDALQRSRKGL